MRTHRLLVAALAIALVAPSFAGKPGPNSPIQEARDHLERARSLVTKKEEGGGKGKGKGKASIPNILNALSNAEVSLKEAKNNKGTNTNMAEKFIAEAKTELEAAKGGGNDDEHLDKAEKAIDEALKRVMQGIRVSH